MLGCKQWYVGVRKTADEAHLVPTSPTAAADQATSCAAQMRLTFTLRATCPLTSSITASCVRVGCATHAGVNTHWPTLLAPWLIPST